MFFYEVAKRTRSVSERKGEEFEELKNWNTRPSKCRTRNTHSRSVQQDEAKINRPQPGVIFLALRACALPHRRIDNGTADTATYTD